MIYMRNITITTAKSATYLENVGSSTPIRTATMSVSLTSFVNGIPLVVVEAESRLRAEKALEQIEQYERGIWRLRELRVDEFSPLRSMTPNDRGKAGDCSRKCCPTTK